MNDPRVEKQKPVPPFVQFCCAAVPMVFDDSLSYYEALCAMWKYLNDTVNVINNNATITEEQLEAYKALETYVQNYFANLDVQQEINNKLDQMAEDGTLTALIGAYVDPIQEAYEAVVDAKLESQDEQIATLNNNISALASSNPVFVASTDDMTDNTKIYVNTTNGYVYYYDGEEFVSSGLAYGANALTFTGNTTPVSSTTDLDDFNNANVNRVYLIMTTNLANKPTAQPGTLITFHYKTPTGTISTKNGMVQMFFQYDMTKVYIRNCYNSTWSDWKEVIDKRLDFTGNTTVVSSTTQLDDFNNATVNRCYLIATTNIPHQPTNQPGTLLTFHYVIPTAPSNRNGEVQVFIEYTGNRMYIRNFWGSVWTNWTQIVQDKYYNYDYSDISLFEKVGVIGDSFASGEIDGVGDVYSISWLQIMARKNGFTGTNFSKGGLSTRTWLTDAKGLTLMNSSEAQQLYLIALGINDIGEINNNTETLGTIADIDLENPESNPNSFYGNYGKILSAITAKSATAKVVLITIPKANAGDNKTINDAIIEIGSTFSLPVLVSHNNPIFTSTYFTNEKGSLGHPTSSGYGTMANAYTQMLNETIATYYNYFKDYVGSGE